jgi:hypothetical protein
MPVLNKKWQLPYLLHNNNMLSENNLDAGIAL